MGFLKIFKKKQPVRESVEEHCGVDFILDEGVVSTQEMKASNNQVGEDVLNNILQDEREYIEAHKDSKYSFFGTFGFVSNELPFFVEEYDATQGARGMSSDMFFPFTPKLLEHCFERLIDKEKEHFAENISSLQGMCRNLANKAVYMNGHWDDTIEKISAGLQKTSVKQTEVQSENIKTI